MYRSGTDVARGRVGKGVLDFCDGWIGIPGQQLHGGYHHAALAIAALWHLLFDPRLLHRV